MLNAVTYLHFLQQSRVLLLLLSLFDYLWAPVGSPFQGHFLEWRSQLLVMER